MEILFKILKNYIKLGLYAPSYLLKLAGYELLRHKRFEEAKTIFVHLQKKHPNRKDGYVGLIDVADRLNQKTLLMERLDIAIAKFPTDIYFIKKQITTLTSIGETEKAIELIEKKSPLFPADPVIALARAKLFRDEYDYKSAQRVLDTAVKKNPDHLELGITQANNYWRSGNYDAAKVVLEKFQPQLDFTKNHLPDQFVFPYIDVLLAGNEIERLLKFFKKAMNGNVRNRQVVSGYFHLLISRNDFEGARKFIEKLIKQEGVDFNLRNYALLFFDLEKIINTQTFMQSRTLISNVEFSIGKFPRFLEKLHSHLETHPDFRKNENSIFYFFSKLEDLSKQHPIFLNTSISPKETFQVAEIIIDQIKKKKPFSFIRLGDGEGHFLPYEYNLKDYQFKDRSSSQKFGGEQKK